jgi:hypothetical protein
MARGLSLKSPSDLRRFLAKIINQLHRKEIEDSQARTLGYLANILREIIKDNDIEARLAEVEKTLKERNKDEY